MRSRTSLDSDMTVNVDATSGRSLEPIFRRIGWRVIPILVLLYVIAFLDRVNVGFASLTMNRDLGISDSAYGLAAGVFFAGYLLFSVPSNLMLARLGAGRWIGAIMVVWGIVSSMQAFVHSATSYTIARFLIGAAEAGFFPGIILYISMWLPRSRRTSVMGFFTVSIPLASIIGAPISTRLMELAGLYGLRGWQWLFLLEGLPAVLLGLAVPRLLASGPEDVLWLAPREKVALLSAIYREDNQRQDTGKRSGGLLTQTLRLAALPSATYFLLMSGLYTLSFWIPRILQNFELSFREIGWTTSLIFAVGGTALIVWSLYANRSSRPQYHLAAAFALAGVGFALAATRTTFLAEAGLAMAASGVLAGMPIFWGSVRSGSGSERAVVIATINAIGNIGGLLGPYLIGLFVAKTHHFSLALTVTAAGMMVGMFTCVFRRDSSLEQLQETSKED
jgi:ACS family tartrate transporter-like MFS transporter